MIRNISTTMFVRCHRDYFVPSLSSKLLIFKCCRILSWAICCFCRCFYYLICCIYCLCFNMACVMFAYHHSCHFLVVSRPAICRRIIFMSGSFDYPWILCDFLCTGSIRKIFSTCAWIIRVTSFCRTSSIYLGMICHIVSSMCVCHRNILWISVNQCICWELISFKR